MSTCSSLTSNKAIIILILINRVKNFLVFHGRLRGEACYFVFTVLPFALASALFIFTKVMRCLVKHWRINAIRIACSFDDGLGVASSYKITLFHSNFVKKCLQNAGFIINEEKSVWEPSQTLIWLRVRINLKNGFYCMPTEKLSAIKNSIVLLIERLPCSYFSLS